MRIPSVRAVRTMITEIPSRVDEISVRARDATITVITAGETAEDLAREDHRALRMDRDNSVETETVMVREDLQDREIPRTEDRVRVMEQDVASVREKAVIIIVATEMQAAADLARADHRVMAARDASEAKTEITAVKDASADRSHRDSVPVVQEEVVVQTQCLHQS